MAGTGPGDGRVGDMTAAKAAADEAEDVDGDGDEDHGEEAEAHPAKDGDRDVVVLGRFSRHA